VAIYFGHRDRLIAVRAQDFLLFEVYWQTQAVVFYFGAYHGLVGFFGHLEIHVYLVKSESSSLYERLRISCLFLFIFLGGCEIVLAR
jgi:hypothetical protein